MVFSLDLRLWRTISKEVFANHGVEFRKEMMEGGEWWICGNVVQESMWKPGLYVGI